MRVISSSEARYTCKNCTSVIGIRPDEISTIGPAGPYDMDYEPDEVGKKYWDCPVCKRRNWVGLAPGEREFDDS